MVLTPHDVAPSPPSSFLHSILAVIAFPKLCPPSFFNFRLLDKFPVLQPSTIPNIFLSTVIFFFFSFRSPISQTCSRPIFRSNGANHRFPFRYHYKKNQTRTKFVHRPFQIKTQYHLSIRITPRPLTSPAHISRFFFFQQYQALPYHLHFFLIFSSRPRNPVSSN